MGYTTLMMSARDGHVKIVELLIAANVHVNAQGKNGTALHLAAIGGQTDCVSVLLKNGADLKLKDEVRHCITIISVKTLMGARIIRLAAQTPIEKECKQELHI